MFCSSCGASNEAGAKFCAKCGKEFGGNNSKFDWKAFFEKNKLYILVGGAVVLLLIILIAATSSSPKKTATIYLDQMLSSKCSTKKILKYSYFSKNIKEITKEEFAKEICLDFDDEEVKYKITDINTKGKKSIVSIKLTINGDTETVKLYLVKDSGTWKVDVYQTSLS